MNMRILWFTNMLMPDAAKYLGYPELTANGWWMVSLLDRLKKENVKLGVVCTEGYRQQRFQINKIDFFIVPTPISRAILNRMRSSLSCKPNLKQIKLFSTIIKEWAPDVIHIHGTERDYGLVRARGMTSVPTMVSIQGLIQVYKRKIFGEIDTRELYGRSPFSTPFWRRNSTRRLRQFNMYASIEKEILQNTDIIAGRTTWDRAWAWCCNPKVKYRHVDEIMREEFYMNKPWSLQNCKRCQIFTTSGNQPLKGLHVLIEAIHFLKPIIPDIKLKVASNGFGGSARTPYARYISRLVEQYDLTSNVEFLGWINAEKLAHYHKQSHCFVTPSFIENSCNALQEAMLVGTPCIASNAGGLTTVLDESETGLCFPAGDSAMLAMCIKKILNDDELAVSLGQNARRIAHERHKPSKVVKQNLECYTELAAMNGKK